MHLLLQRCVARSSHAKATWNEKSSRVLRGNGQGNPRRRTSRSCSRMNARPSLISCNTSRVRPVSPDSFYHPLTQFFPYSLPRPSPADNYSSIDSSILSDNVGALSLCTGDMNARSKRDQFLHGGSSARPLDSLLQRQRRPPTIRRSRLCRNHRKGSLSFRLFTLHPFSSRSPGLASRSDARRWMLIALV